MSFGTGIYKMTVTHPLDMSAKNGFYVLFRVLRYSLELINGYNTWFVRFSKNWNTSSIVYWGFSMCPIDIVNLGIPVIGSKL